MERRPISLSKFLTSIEEALHSCDRESCMEFVCGTIILFEKSFGPENKAAMQKMLKEAVDNFGHDSMDRNIECMIPILCLLRKYCKLSFVYEVFERLYEKESYRRCATFFVEWSRSHAEFEEKLEILELGFCSKAEPVCVLKNEEEALKLEKTSFVQERIGPGQPTYARDIAAKNSLKELSAKRALFSGKSTNFVESDSSSNKSSTDYDFVFPTSNNCLSRKPSTISSHRHSSPLYNLDMPRASDAITSSYPDPNAENINPAGAHTEVTVKRKHAGILVASLDFTLEDYDLGDDTCVITKSAEVLKREDNENNIKNNLSEEVGPSGSSISPRPTMKRLTPSPTLSDT
ncbi:hypothetical protein KIN20_020656 [Parelaphostrongylus tenuis]|uniref:Uncharacterized protein n=1 Tax=Parelaphostrongylus tenuis TaxID=148309 RepID=A0AAD5MMR9_PARTN|nr:hypothetical protein KIN20_020656 [Parelaphostrongylus tenuis]